MIINLIQLFKESVKSDSQLFHQYQ